MISNVGVLGAGSWGTALAIHLARKGLPVMMWSRDKEHAEASERARKNTQYLTDFELPPSLHLTASLEEAIRGADMLLSAVPSHGLREVLDRALPLMERELPIVSATKGIENGSLKLVSEIFEDHLSSSQKRLVTCLSGPSFAKEVALGMPTAVSLAGTDEKVMSKIQAAFVTDRFRVYTTDDVIGVEIGGALKNVIAIAAGIADGLGFGTNTRAALITRGLAEISRLAVARGGHPLTLAGLSGMGDLVLTCTGDLSRNRKVGLELGRGRKLAEILASMTMVAEGVLTTRSAHDLSRRENVNMPIVEAVYQILYEDVPPLLAVTSLMTRAQRAERD